MLGLLPKSFVEVSLKNPSCMASQRQGEATFDASILADADTNVRIWSHFEDFDRCPQLAHDVPIHHPQASQERTSATARLAVCL